MRRFLLLFYTLLCLASMALCQQNDFNWSKIDPELKKDIENSTKSDEMFRVLVVMEEQYDQNEMENLTRDMDNETAREFVINEMKRFTGVAQANISDVMRNQKANTVRNLHFFWIFNGFACESSTDVISMLSKRADIKIVCNGKKHKMIPEDWEPKPVQSQTKGNAWNVEKVNADDVWVYDGATGYTGNGVIVAVIDSGVNYNHTDISSNMWNGGSTYPHHGYDFVNDDNDPMDDNGHGTHCAGTVAGYGTNGTQTGIAPNAIIMALKALDYKGDGGSVDIIDAMEFALSHGADVLSMSLGAAGVGGFYAYRDAMITLKTARVAAAVAAGNEGDELSDYPVPYNVGAPGNCPPPYLHPDQTLIGGTSATISVGATNNNDQKASFSSIGPVTWADGAYIGNYHDYPYTEGSITQIGLIRPDVAAPGVNITSLAYNSNTGYCEMSGTSMATPCVAGVIALMLEADPTLTPADIDRILETTAVKCGGEIQKNNNTGSGRVDALAAINAVVGNCSAPTELSVTLGEDGAILTWTAAENVDSYIIYRNDNVIEFDVGGTSYIDPDLYSDQDVYYYLRSLCSDGSTSVASNVVFLETDACDAPTNLAATVVENSIELTWSASDADSYVVYRNGVIIETNATGTSYIDGFLSEGTYRYYLKSKCPGGGISSSSSNIIEASISYSYYYDIGSLKYTLNSITGEACVVGLAYGFSSCQNIVIPSSVVYTNEYDQTRVFQVTSIRQNAFNNKHEIVSVTIPCTITSIGSYAFGHCSGMTSVYYTGDIAQWCGIRFTNDESNPLNYAHNLYIDNTLVTNLVIPNTVTEIKNYAFYGCSCLTGALTIPNSVVTIGERAFYNCSGFTGLLTIPNSINNIRDYAFYGCSFNGLYIDITNIPYDYMSSAAFLGCAFTGSLTIGNSVMSIGAKAFDGCEFTGSLTIGNSVTSIGDMAFDFCHFTGTLTLGNSVVTIGYGAFYDCGFTGSLTIPNSVTTIGDGAFSDCGFNGSLTILNDVTDFGSNIFEGSSFDELIVDFDEIPNSFMSKSMFYGCSISGPLTIGNTVTSIGDRAFDNCGYFTGPLTLGNSITNIGDYAFRDCSGLTSVYYTGDIAQWCGIQFTGASNPLYHAHNLYIDNTLVTNLVIPNTVTEIKDYAFYGCSCLTGALTIPNSVTTIGQCAFNDCSGFTGSLTIPNSVNTIGKYAFSRCSFNGLYIDITDIPDDYMSLSAFDGCEFTGSLTIGNSVTNIGDFAFEKCTFTGSLTIGNSVTSIGKYAFRDCSGFTGSLVIGNSVVSIGNWAFDGCSGFLESLTIPASTTTVGRSAFYDCGGFTSVHYTGSLAQWLNIDFADDYSNPLRKAHELYINDELLTTLVIPSSVAEIKNYTFYGCTSLTGSLIIPNTVLGIGDSSFSDCSNLTSISIGNSVTTIGEYAFWNCGFTGSLTIPNSVITIGYNAFRECRGIISLNIGNSVTNIENGAFYNCKNIIFIQCDCLTPPTLETSWWSNPFYGIDKYITVKVPCGTQEDYKSAQCWSEFENIHETEYGLVVTRNDECGGEVSVLEWADCEDNHCAILATPNIGYTFNGWYVNDEFVTGSESYDFSITEDVFFEARFARNENHYIANGTSNTWSDPDTWDTGEVPTGTSTVAIYKNIIVDVSANVSAIGVYDDNTITINPDVVLTVEDELLSHNALSIVIEDGGQIIHSNEDVMATVNKTIEPYTSDDDGWNLISFPLTGNGTIASVTNILSHEYDLFAYDEPSYTWINQKDDNNYFTELEAGMGYLYANKGKGVGAVSGTKIGDGTSTTGYTPFYTYYNYSISENLFLASELESAGLSTSALGALCWYATNETGYQHNNISIWMANVNDAALTNTSHNVTGMTLVYTGSITPEIGWNEFVFNENTFTWDGASNILVCVQRNNGAYNSSIYWQAHDSGFNAMSYKYNDVNSYDMTTETYSMSLSSSSRPNTIFQTVDQIGEFESYESITISFAGEVENGIAEVTVPLSYTNGNKLSGFNLVGNPFVHNVTSYDGYNVADGCYRINDAKTNLFVSNISNENPLKVGEGFFVKATGNNASITFNSQTRKSPDERSLVRMELVENDKIIDRLIVKKDGVPLKKMSLRGNHTELFARYDSERVSIVPIQGPAQPVCFKAVRMGSYTITVDIENLDIDYLHLIDNFTGKDIDLLIEPQYNFVGASDDSENRFMLVFDKSANDTNSEVFAYQNGNEIIVSGNGTLQIFDVMGRMVATQPINGVVTMYTSSLQTGVYIFRLLGESPRTQKIVVR